MIRVLTVIFRGLMMRGIFAVVAILFGRGSARTTRTLARRTRQVHRFTRWR
jgi:hypothetical protein